MAKQWKQAEDSDSDDSSDTSEDSDKDEDTSAINPAHRTDHESEVKRRRMEEHPETSREGISCVTRDNVNAAADDDDVSSTSSDSSSESSSSSDDEKS